MADGVLEGLTGEPHTLNTRRDADPIARQLNQLQIPGVGRIEMAESRLDGPTQQVVPTQDPGLANSPKGVMAVNVDIGKPHGFSTTSEALAKAAMANIPQPVDGFAARRHPELVAPAAEAFRSIYGAALLNMAGGQLGTEQPAVFGQPVQPVNPFPPGQPVVPAAVPFNPFASSQPAPFYRADPAKGGSQPQPRHVIFDIPGFGQQPSVYADIRRAGPVPHLVLVCYPGRSATPDGDQPIGLYVHGSDRIFTVRPAGIRFTSGGLEFLLLAILKEDLFTGPPDGFPQTAPDLPGVAPGLVPAAQDAGAV